MNPAVWILLPGLLQAQEPPQEPASTQEPARAPEVVVVGRAEEQGVPEVPLRFPGQREVFGPDFLRRTGARDLNDLVQNLPGLSTRPYNGGEAAAPSFSSRGLPDDGLTEYVHVMIDGVPASPQPYGWTAFSFLPITTERVWAVETLRGGHTVRYSPDTVGGVVNFITRPLPEEPFLESRMTSGSDGFQAASMVFGGAVPGGRALGSWFERSGDGYRADGGFRQRDTSAKWRADHDDGGWTAVQAGWMEDYHKAPGGLDAATFAADRYANSRPENYFDGARGVVSAVHREVEGDAWLETFADLSVTERRLYARRDKGGGTFLDDWTDESWFASVGMRGEQPMRLFGVEHELYGGVRLHREWLPDWQIDSTPVAGGPTARIQDAAFRLTSLGAHLDDTFEPVTNLTVTAGVRVEWVPATSGSDEVAGFAYEDDFLAILPAAGAAWEFADDWALFANWGEGFRAPQFWGYAFAADPQDALEFERGASSELGVRHQAGGGVDLQAAAWQVDFDDYLVFDTGFYENVGAIRSRGIDLTGTWRAGEALRALEGFTFYTTVTWQDSELRSGPDAGNDTPYAWDLQAAWRATWEPGAGWSVSLGGVYVGESYSDTANTVADSSDGRTGLNEGWTLWDARLARSFPLGEHAVLEAAAGVTNLFDKEWDVHSRGGFFGPGLVAGMPRQSYVALLLDLGW